MRFSVALTVAAALLALPATAAADVADGPEPDPQCEPVPECRACNTQLGEGEGGGEVRSFGDCAAEAENAGLVEACDEPDRYGGGSTIYFCPPGVDIAASGCSIVPGLPTEAALVSGGILLAAASLARARRKAKAQR